MIPGTALERARAVANALLLELDGAQREVWTARAHAVGETWLGASVVRWGADDVVSTAEAAEMVHVRPGTIRMWCSMGRLANAGRPGRYRVGAVLDAAAPKMR